MPEQDQLLRAPYVRVVDGVSISDLTGVYGFPNDGAPQLMRTLRRALDEQFRKIRPMSYQTDLNCWLHISRSPRSALCIYLFTPMAAELARRHELILLATPILVDENQTHFWEWELTAWDAALGDAVNAHNGKAQNFDVSVDELVSDYLFRPKEPGDVQARLYPARGKIHSRRQVSGGGISLTGCRVKRVRKATTRNEVIGEWCQ